MQTVVLMFDSGLIPLLPIALHGHPVVHAWTEGVTLKHTIEALGVPRTEIGRVLVDGRAMALEALLPAWGHVAVSIVELFLPAAPLHFLCDAHLGATACLLHVAGFGTVYNNNYADAAIEALTHKEDWIMLSHDRGLLKRRGIRCGTFICAREPQVQMREIVIRLRLADATKPFSRCLECDMLLRMLGPEGTSANVPPRVRERQRFFNTCDVCRRVYWPDSYWARMNAALAGMLWPEASASADSTEAAEHMPRTGSAGA